MANRSAPRLSKYLIVVLSLVVLAACGSADTTTTTAAAGNATTTTAADPGETTSTEGGAEDPSDGGLVIDGEQIADAELYDAALEEGRILAYAAMSAHNAELLFGRFTEDTGIAVDLVPSPSSPLLERILTEVGAGVFEADVISTADQAMVKTYADENLWEAHKVPAWEDLDPNLISPDGFYYAFPYPVVIIYNTELVDEVPTSWEALADPQYSGRNGVLTAGLGGSSFALAMFQRKVVAEDFWQRHAENEPVTFTGQAPLTEAVARGELLVGSGQLAPLRDQVASGAPIAAAFASEGSPTAAVYMGLSSHAANPNAGRVFVNWVTSEAGGKVYGETLLNFSPNVNVADPLDAATGVGAPPRDQLWFPDGDEVAEVRDAWVDEWDQIMSGHASTSG